MRPLAPWAVLLALAAGCEDRTLTIRYYLDPADVDPARVSAIDTLIVPVAPQRFAAPAATIELERGVEYTVECTDCTASGCRPGCVLKLRLTHAASRGFVFATRFEQRFAANPDGTAERLLVSAVARDTAGEVIGRVSPIETSFSARVELPLRLRVRCGGALCDPDQACCDERCVRLADDEAHCGACGAACAEGERCIEGACRCGNQPGCAAGQTCCDEQTCADLQTSPTRCGACGTPCKDGERCEAGACRCGPDAACGAGQRCCGSNGACVAADAPCPCGTGPDCDAPSVCCDDPVGGAPACANVIAGDPRNCGACGNDCGRIDPSLGCAERACVCGTQSCSASCCGGECADLTSDERHCGACGAACAAGEQCIAGRCQCNGVACAEGQLCCDGNCVAQDKLNCGACDRACTGGSDVCDPARTCVCAATGAACPAGQTCCGDGCSDLTTTAHCGSCTTACAVGESCRTSDRTCQPTTCAPSCTDNGNTCAGGVCSCGGGAQCAAPRRCCGGSCVALDSDVSSCGACGVRCGAGEVCSSGQCRCGGKFSGGAGPACLVSQYCTNAFTGTCANIDAAHCATRASPIPSNCSLLTLTPFCCGGGLCDDAAKCVAASGACKGAPGCNFYQ